MRKRITVFVALIMVLCLAITGCGQNTDKQEENQTSESSTTDNSSIENSDKVDEATSPGGIQQIDDDSYADDAAQDLNQDTIAEDNDSQSENTNADGTYSWQVGSNTLTTNINVMDYIDGDIWHANEMAAAIGWDPIATKKDGSQSVSMTAKQPFRYQTDEFWIVYSSGAEKINYFTGNTSDGQRLFGIGTAIDSNDFSYRMNDSDHYITLDLIICFAYAMENMQYSPDPFTDFNMNGADYVI